MRSEDFDILIVGAGPAGIAAACAAVQGAEQARRVAVVDDNRAPGGQIWRRGLNSSPRNRSAARWIERFQWSRCRTLNSTTIFAAPHPGLLLAEDLIGAIELRYKKLILATGARERFLPFPGWTSPRVMGAGGLQAMVKSGMPIAGKRVIVAGSGPLLPAVAATLKQSGAKVLLIAEQASWDQMAPFALHLLGGVSKLWHAAALKTKLIGIEYCAGCWPVKAIDRTTSLRATLQMSTGPREIDCDYLASGFFLIPNLELGALLGCQTNDDGLIVDQNQQTTIANVYAAGETTGIGGLDKSLIEGQIAGHAAAGNMEGARRLFKSRARSHLFATALRQSFQLRDELKQLAHDATIICRCEDIPYARLKSHQSMREAKLQTRCGMGPCQGRICGPACQFLFGWDGTSVRPPIFPTAMENLAM